MRLLYWFYSKLFGRNLPSTPKEVIVDQMLEPRPLPMGRSEFESWSDRIIAGALLNGGADCPEVFIESQKWALANMIMHIGPTESHKPDAHFIHGLRVNAVKLVAHEMFGEYKALEDIRKKAKRAAQTEEDKNRENQSGTDGKI